MSKNDNFDKVLNKSDVFWYLHLEKLGLLGMGCFIWRMDTNSKNFRCYLGFRYRWRNGTICRTSICRANLRYA